MRVDAAQTQITQLSFDH